MAVAPVVVWLATVERPSHGEPYVNQFDLEPNEDTPNMFLFPLGLLALLVAYANAKACPAFTCVIPHNTTAATSVHRLRPNDITVVGAMGDSITWVIAPFSNPIRTTTLLPVQSIGWILRSTISTSNAPPAPKRVVRPFCLRPVHVHAQFRCSLRVLTSSSLDTMPRS
jgi:hypothetical protein